jgi:hypothetical protein
LPPDNQPREASHVYKARALRALVRCSSGTDNSTAALLDPDPTLAKLQAARHRRCSSIISTGDWKEHAVDAIITGNIRVDWTPIDNKIRH